jgi:hypothetical protein
VIVDLRKFLREIESLVFIVSPFCKHPDSPLDEIIQRASMRLLWGSTGSIARSRSYESLFAAGLQRVDHQPCCASKNCDRGSGHERHFPTKVGCY